MKGERRRNGKDAKEGEKIEEEGKRNKRKG